MPQAMLRRRANATSLFHGFTYPDENPKHDLVARFWAPTMRNGVIEFDRPDSANLDCRIIRENQTVKSFKSGENFRILEGDE